MAENGVTRGWLPQAARCYSGYSGSPVGGFGVDSECLQRALVANYSHGGELLRRSTALESVSERYPLPQEPHEHETSS